MNDKLPAAIFRLIFTCMILLGNGKQRSGVLVACYFGFLENISDQNFYSTNTKFIENFSTTVSTFFDYEIESND